MTAEHAGRWRSNGGTSELAVPGLTTCHPAAIDLDYHDLDGLDPGPRVDGGTHAIQDDADAT